MNEYGMDRLAEIVGEAPSELEEAEFVKRLKWMHEWEEVALTTAWPKPEVSKGQTYVKQTELKALFKELGVSPEDVLCWLKR